MNNLTTITTTDLVRSLSDLLMPRTCVVCGTPLLTCEQHLCVCCLADMPFTHFEAMPRNPMGDRLNALVDAPSYLRAAALFHYGPDYGRISRALKYGRNFAVGKWAAGMLGERLRAAGWQAGAVCCVLRTLLNPGDEVICFAPFFGEYNT